MESLLQLLETSFRWVAVNEEWAMECRRPEGNGRKRRSSTATNA
jgi:hypothetical protein